MARVQLESVNKTYPDGKGGVAAVREVSLDISDGEFVALVGPSGCGKTTTLRMIAGLEDITSGTIRIGGRVVNDVHPRDRDIAMVFQNYALYPHMTVEKNMSFALRMRKVPRAEIKRRVAEAARVLGIEELLGRKPRQLSGGQRQRVAVGRAIVREPKAFLFDEPLSNLDARLRLTTRAELKALHQRLKTTTVYVTHDQEEAMTLGDRIVVMSKGVVQQVGPPLEVYRRPANRFVAGFIGSPPMNFLNGTVVSEGGAAVFVENAHVGFDAPPARVRLAGVGGRSGEMVLGVRPQALRPPTAGREGEIEVVVRVVEPLGDSVDVHGSTVAGSPIVARVPAGEVGFGVGERVRLRVESAHVFEVGEFGRAVG